MKKVDYPKGEIIGGLKFLEMVGYKNSGKFANFECLNCGKVVLKNYHNVKNRKPISCGCIKAERKKTKKKSSVNLLTLERLCKKFNLKLDKEEMTVNGFKIYYKGGRWLLKTDDTDIVKAVYKKFGYHKPTVAENYRGIF